MFTFIHKGIDNHWGIKDSLIVRIETQRIKLNIDPALSFVPEERLPPKGADQQLLR